MTNTTQSNVEGIAVDVSAFAKHAEAVFKQLVEQTAIQTRPQRRHDSLATLKRLGVVTEVEADTIGTILANGDGSAPLDIDKIVAAIDVARNRTSSPATSAILNVMSVAARNVRSANQAMGARRISRPDQWAEVGDAIVFGAAGGAAAGAAVGAAGTAGFGALGGAVGGAVIGGVLGGMVKALSF